MPNVTFLYTGTEQIYLTSGEIEVQKRIQESRTIFRHKIIRVVTFLFRSEIRNSFYFTYTKIIIHEVNTLSA
jgi:hypothetical protein